MHDSTEGRCESIEASAEERYKVDVRHVSEVSTMNGVLIVRGFQPCSCAAFSASQILFAIWRASSSVSKKIRGVLPSKLSIYLGSPAIIRSRDLLTGRTNPDR